MCNSVINETTFVLSNIIVMFLWFQVAAMGQGKNTNLFPNYLLYEFQGLSGGRIWKTEHDLLLLKGILKYVSVNISLCYNKFYNISSAR